MTDRILAAVYELGNLDGVAGWLQDPTDLPMLLMGGLLGMTLSLLALSSRGRG